MKTDKSCPFEYTQSGKHLPLFLRDFHDQKDVFKAIQALYSKGENPPPGNFRDNMVYVIDYFLWFMGQRGYTLQKSRAKVDFLDMQKDIEADKTEKIKIFTQMFKSPSQAS